MIYLLFEKINKDQWTLCDYSEAIWINITHLLIYLRDNRLSGKTIIVKTATNSWIVNGRFKIIETKLN